MLRIVKKKTWRAGSRPGNADACRCTALLGIILAFSFAREPVNKLITTAALDSVLGRENLCIVDAREKVEDYWQSHVPGAVYCSPEAIRLADGGVPVKIVPADILAELLGRMGIDYRTVVVVYGEKSDWRAAYFIWALDYIGHKAALLLDGGFEKWQKEGHHCSQSYPAVTARKYGAAVRADAEVRADLTQVVRAVERKTALLLDARPSALYSGVTGFWKRKGHIKGAINHYWGDDLRPDGTWKSRAELIDDYARLEIDDERPVIVTCGQGQMSAHAYFTLKYILGHTRVKNYDGGFSEWSSVDSLPIQSK